MTLLHDSADIVPLPFDVLDDIGIGDNPIDKSFRSTLFFNDAKNRFVLLSCSSQKKKRVERDLRCHRSACCRRDLRSGGRREGPRRQRTKMLSHKDVFIIVWVCVWCERFTALFNDALAFGNVLAHGGGDAHRDHAKVGNGVHVDVNVWE